MEQVYSYTAGFEIFAYIAVMVAIYLFKAMKKMKSNDTIKPFVPGTPIPNTYDERPKQVQRYEDVEDDWSYASDPGYETSYKEEHLNEALESSKGDLYKALADIKTKQEGLKQGEQPAESERFERFKIKENRKNYLSDLLDSPENLKKAFVLSEVLNKKF